MVTHHLITYASGVTGLLRQTTHYGPLGLLIGLLYTNLRAPTVLQRAGAVLQHRSGGPEQYLLTPALNLWCLGFNWI